MWRIKRWQRKIPSSTRHLIKLEAGVKALASFLFMKASTYRNKLRALSRKNCVPQPHSGQVVCHILHVWFFVKHRDTIPVEVGAHSRNLYPCSNIHNVNEDGQRIGHRQCDWMRDVAPEIDPERADWWRWKAEYHRGRII